MIPDKIPLCFLRYADYIPQMLSHAWAAISNWWNAWPLFDRLVVGRSRQTGGRYIAITYQFQKVAQYKAGEKLYSELADLRDDFVFMRAFCARTLQRSFSLHFVYPTTITVPRDCLSTYNHLNGTSPTSTRRLHCGMGMCATSRAGGCAGDARREARGSRAG